MKSKMIASVTAIVMTIAKVVMKSKYCREFTRFLQDLVYVIWLCYDLLIDIIYYSKVFYMLYILLVSFLYNIRVQGCHESTI